MWLQLSPSAVPRTPGNRGCVLVGEPCQSSCRCCRLHKADLHETSLRDLGIEACLTWSSLKAILRGWCCTLPAQALGKSKVRVSVHARKFVCEQGAFSFILPMYTLALLWVNSPLGSLRPLWVSHSGGWQHCFRSSGWGRQGQGTLPPTVAPYCRGLGTLVTSFHAIPGSCRRAAAEREELTMKAECALQVLRKEMPT